MLPLQRIVLTPPLGRELQVVFMEDALFIKPQGIETGPGRANELGIPDSLARRITHDWRNPRRAPRETKHHEARQRKRSTDTNQRYMIAYVTDEEWHDRD